MFKYFNVWVCSVIFAIKIFGQPAPYEGLQVQYKVCDGCSCSKTGNDGINSLFTYGQATSYITHDVTSDFDLRNEPGASRWHKGIDYSRPSVFTDGCGGDDDIGDALLAIESGTIIRLNGGAGFKYMAISGTSGNILGYGHIFRKKTTVAYQKSGNFVLKALNQLVGGQVHYAIIDLGANPVKAYSDVVGTPASPVTVTFEGQTYNATNIVSAGDMIAPIGSSIDGASIGVAGHLHLYRFRAGSTVSDANCADPWQVVAHPLTNYDLLYSNQLSDPGGSDIWGQFIPKYNQNGKNYLKVRAKMKAPNGGLAVAGGADDRYENVAMNLDKVRVLLKKEGETSSPTEIRGDRYMSKFELGARMATARYPTNLPTMAYGNYTTTGVNPYSYKSGVEFKPYDDFYFCDIQTRIHNGDTYTGPMQYADMPNNARYNDGNYQMTISVTDVRNAPLVSSPINFTLDNFKPYIRKVNVNLNGAETYQGVWESNEGSLTVANDGSMNLAKRSAAVGTTGTLQVVVYSSEPLNNLSLTLNNGAATNGVPSTIDPLRWTFTYPAFGSNSASCYDMEFTGTDKSGNGLFDITSTTQNGCFGGNVNIPRRIATAGTNQWSMLHAYGLDKVHNFCLAPCSSFTPKSSSSTCLQPSDVTVTTHPPSGGINLSVTGGTPNYSYSWSVLPVWPATTGTPISANQNLTGMPPGIYCYEVSDANCCAVSDCVELTGCSTIGIGLIPLPTSCSGQTGQIQVLDFIMPPTVHTYLWSNGSTAHDLTGLAAGNYCVTVTDQATGCFTSQCATVTSLAITAAVTDACSVGQYGSINLSVTGSSVPLSYYWSNGATTEDINNLVVGNYCVTVSDNLFCSIVKCFEVKSQLANEVFIASIKNPTTCGVSNNGKIDIQVTGNLADYSYLWSTGATTQDLNAPLGPGTYTVTVTDNWGCKITKQATLCCCTGVSVNSCSGGTPAALTLSGILNFPSAANPTSGAIDLVVSGGTTPYYYQWSVPGGGFQYSQDLSNIGIGQYCVT